MTNNFTVNAIWAMYQTILTDIIKTCGVYKGIEETAVEKTAHACSVTPKAIGEALDEAAFRADFEDFEE